MPFVPQLLSRKVNFLVRKKEACVHCKLILLTWVMEVCAFCWSQLLLLKKNLREGFNYFPTLVLWYFATLFSYGKWELWLCCGINMERVDNKWVEIGDTRYVFKYFFYKLFIHSLIPKCFFIYWYSTEYSELFLRMVRNIKIMSLILGCWQTSWKEKHTFGKVTTSMWKNTTRAIWAKCRETKL